MSEPTQKTGKTGSFKKTSKETKIEGAQTLPKKAGLYTTKNIILLIGCILLMGLGAGLYFGVKTNFEIYPDDSKVTQQDNTQPSKQLSKTQNAPIKLADENKQGENEKTLLDFILSKSKKDLSYLVLSYKENTYLLAITEDKNIQDLLKSRKLHIGQKVVVETSEPIKFKKEPREITELKKKLKRVTLVKLKKLETVEAREF